MKKLTNNEHVETKANGWIFLSHSSDDYQDVKWVRNYLEDHGFSVQHTTTHFNSDGNSC